MTEPSLHHVRAFVSVVKLRSFAKAAVELKMTASSVSRLVKALEQELGVVLINRTTRAMSLTDPGKHFYADCGAAFDQLQSAFERVRDEHDRPRGILKLSTPVSFGRTHVVPHLAAFMEAYPEVQLDLLITDRYVDVVAEGVLVAIRIGRLDNSSLVARKLLSNCRILVASPAYLAKRGVPAELDDLKQHECIMLTVNRDGEHWRLVGKHGERSIRPRGRARADSGDAVRQFAIDGMGIGFLSAVTVAPTIRSGELVQVLPQWTGRDTGVYCVCAHQPVDQTARAVIDFLSKRWKDNDADPGPWAPAR